MPYQVHFTLDCSLWVEDVKENVYEFVTNEILEELTYGFDKFHPDTILSNYEPKIDGYNIELTEWFSEDE